jgi:hypothetical protein
MSSYELLELLEFMPERGAFKEAARGCEYSDEEKVWVQIANELAVLRAAYVPKADADKYGAQLFFSPAKLREMAAAEEHQQEVREHFYGFASRPSARALNPFPGMEGDS